MLGFSPVAALPISSGTPSEFNTPLVNPSEDYALEALRLLLMTFVASDVEIVRGQDNRVPEPRGPNFVVMTPIRRTRLATNQDEMQDAVFIGTIIDSVMTVRRMIMGELRLGGPVFGVGVEPGTRIVEFLTSEGAEGTYTVSPSQRVQVAQLAGGTLGLVQSTMLVLQVDVHGPDSGNIAQTLTTALRDEYATLWLERNYPEVGALHADEGKQIPFIDGEKEYEDRWVIEVSLQINPKVTLPLEFAEEVSTTLANADALYPA